MVRYQQFSSVTAGIQPGDEEGFEVFRCGWCVGSEAFRQEQLQGMEGKLGDHHAVELRRETAEAKGERIMAEEVTRLGWQESDLVARRKGDPDKLGIAVRLRRETTLSIKAIAARGRMGTFKSANARLHPAMRKSTGPDPNQGRFEI